MIGKNPLVLQLILIQLLNNNKVSATQIREAIY